MPCHAKEARWLVMSPGRYVSWAWVGDARHRLKKLLFPRRAMLRLGNIVFNRRQEIRSHYLNEIIIYFFKINDVFAQQVNVP